MALPLVPSVTMEEQFKTRVKFKIESLLKSPAKIIELVGNWVRKISQMLMINEEIEERVLDVRPGGI